MPTIEERFRVFHEKNPQVYEEIVRLARIARKRGHTRYGIDLLLAVVRFRHDMRAGITPDASGFKLNNNYKPWYARLVMEREPDLAGFFETRELRTA